MPGVNGSRQQGFCLFVTLPSGRVVTLRDLQQSVPVQDLICRLELLAALPAQVYELRRTDGTLVSSDSRLEFGDSITDGVVLKARLLPEYSSVYWTIHRSQVVELMIAVYSSADDKNVFPALYMAAGLGNVVLCRKLIKSGADVSMTTRFGHSPLHAAAASDSLGVVQLLVQSGCRVGAPDIQGTTALGVARQQEATSCERWMRLWCLSRQGWASEHHTNSSSGSTKSADEDQTGHTADTPGYFHDEIHSTLSAEPHNKSYPPTRDSASSLSFLSVKSAETHRNRSGQPRQSQTKKRSRRRNRSPPGGVSSSWTCNPWRSAGGTDLVPPLENRWVGRPFSPSAGFKCRVAPTNPITSPMSVIQPSPRGPTPSPRVTQRQHHKQSRLEVDLRNGSATVHTDVDPVRDTGSDSGSSRGSRGEGRDSQQASQAAYEDWLENKKEMLKDIMKRQREKAASSSIREKDKDRIVSVFRLGDTDPTPIKSPDPAEYAKSYHRWRSEHQQSGDGVAMATPRRGSVIDPQTYEEWLEKKEKPSKRRNSLPAEKSSPPLEKNIMILSDLSEKKNKKPARKVTWKQ